MTWSDAARRASAAARRGKAKGSHYTKETRRQRPIRVDAEHHALDESGKRRFLGPQDFKPRRG